MDRALELAETIDGFDAAALEGTQMTPQVVAGCGREVWCGARRSSGGTL